MAFKIGANIALDGEKEYRQAMTEITNAMKVQQSEMKLVAAQYSKNASSMAAYTAKQEVLTKQVDAQKDKIKLLEGALERSQDKYKSAAQNTETLRAALDKAKNAYGENSEEVKKLEKELAAAEKQQNKYLSECSKTEATLNDAKTALKKMNDELEETKKHTSGIGKVKTAVHELKEKVEEAKQKTEKLREAMSKIGDAAKAGLAAGATAVAALGAAAVKAGKEIYSMATEVAELGDEVEKNSQKVGLSYESYQKWNYAMQISGTDMASCTNGLKTLTNTFDDAINGSDKAAEKFSRLGLSVESMKGLNREQVFSEVVAALQNVSDETEKAALANDMFGKSGQNLIPMFNMTQDELAALMQEAEDYGMVLSDDAVKASAAFNDSIKKLQGTAQGLKNLFIGELLPSITGITDGLSELFNGDSAAGIDMISEAVGQFIDKISEMAPKALELGGSILSAIVTSISNNLPMLLRSGTDIIMSLAGSIMKSGNLSAIIEAAFVCIETLVTGMEDNLDVIIDATVEIIQALTTGLLEHLPQIMEAGIELLLGLISGLADAGTLEMIIEAGITCAGELVQGLIRCVPDLLNAGWQLIKGLWQGISNAAGWLWEQIKGIGSQLVSTVKGIFGIKSPSSVMRDQVGKNLMMGLAEGITDYAAQAQAAMRQATDGLTGSADMTYRMRVIDDQIYAAQQFSAARTWSGMPQTDAATGSGVPLETVIALLQQIAANSGKTPVFMPDGNFVGYIDHELGVKAGMAGRNV